MGILPAAPEAVLWLSIVELQTREAVCLCEAFQVSRQLHWSVWNLLLTFYSYRDDDRTEMATPWLLLLLLLLLLIVVVAAVVVDVVVIGDEFSISKDYLLRLFVCRM